ncbi:MAG: Fic family protein [Thiobacillus sp.]|nr:Fic family protein [Thiobacillus sp.]
MKIPLSPPPLKELIQEANAETLPQLAQLRLGPLANGRYLHWDDLRHRTTPNGLSHKIWWLALSLARSISAHTLPFHDKQGKAFTYSLPEPLLKNLHEIDRSAGLVPGGEGNATLRSDQGRYLFSSLIEEAITSSQLEGASTTRRVAEAMLREGRKPSTLSERMIFNNFEAMRRIREICGDTLEPEHVIELQRVLTEGTMERPEDCGRLRTSDDIEIVAPNNDRLVLHRPPPHSELPKRLKILCDFANESLADDTFIHPIVRAILLHFMVGYDHPFADGNGRTGRALFYWYMAKQGYWLVEYLSISRILRKAPAQYARAYLLTETDSGDTTYFLLHQTEVILSGLSALHQYLQQKQQEQAQLHSKLRTLQTYEKQLNHRQTALLAHALKRPDEYFTIESHQRSHQIAYATARADLLSLAALGLLNESAHGGRKKVFYPAPDIRQKLDTV